MSRISWTHSHIQKGCFPVTFTIDAVDWLKLLIKHLTVSVKCNNDVQWNSTLQSTMTSLCPAHQGMMMLDTNSWISLTNHGNGGGGTVQRRAGVSTASPSAPHLPASEQFPLGLKSMCYNSGESQTPSLPTFSSILSCIVFSIPFPLLCLEPPPHPHTHKPILISQHPLRVAAE